MMWTEGNLNFCQQLTGHLLFFPKHSHKSQSLWEMRQVQAFATANDEKKEDKKEEKKRVEPGQPAAQWGPECSISRNLEDTGEDDAQRGASFCTVLFPSTSFFACSHICCLVVCFFFTAALVSKVHIFIYKLNSVICRKNNIGLVCIFEAQICWIFRVKTVPSSS